MHSFRVIHSTVIACLTAVASCWAESGAEQAFTRTQAVAYGLSHNLNLEAARTTIDQARARSMDAGAWENPVLNLGVASDYGLTDEGQYTYGIGFEQQFPITNRLQLLEDIAGIEIKLAEAEIRERERLLALDLESQLVRLIALDAQIRIRKELLELNQRLTQFIQTKVESAEASPIDVNQLRVSLYATEQEIQQLVLRREELAASLGLLMGLPVGDELLIDGGLNLPVSEPELLEMSQGSLELHPEYQLKALLAQMADKRTDLALAERWADIAVEVFYEQERSFDGAVGLKDDRFIGVGFSIPLPIHNQNRGEIEASRAYRRQVQYELDAVTLTIRSRSAVYAKRVLRLYGQAVEYEQQVTRLVEQNMEDMNAAYTAGQVDLTTLFRAQEQALTIQSSQLDLLRDYELALVEWRAATASNLRTRGQ